MGIYNQHQMAELQDQLLTLQQIQMAIIQKVDKNGQQLNQHATHLNILDELIELISNCTYELGWDLAQSKLTTSLFTKAQDHVSDIMLVVEAAMDRGPQSSWHPYAQLQPLFMNWTLTCTPWVTNFSSTNLQTCFSVG
jgi:hypothetical protein